MMRCFRLLSLTLLTAAPMLGASGVPGGFSASVIVDGVPAPEYCGRGRIYVEARKGKEFAIRLSNPTGGRVAVALSVDGRNVVDAKRTSALDAAKWILAPGQTVDIPGWQVSGATARKFFFTETSRSYAKWLGDASNAGMIEAVFFREKPVPPAIATRPSAAEVVVSGEAPMADSQRAGGSSEPAAPRREKAKDADSLAATGIGDRTSFPVAWVGFDEAPEPAARIAIRYEFHSELVRLGLVPREDALFARDRARGFEHDYAPDPDRNR